MANDESILREVEQELAEDRQSEMFRKYGPMIIGAGAAIVVGVAGLQLWNARADSVAKAQALEYSAAVELLAEDQDGGRSALGGVAEEGGGYGVLANLQSAASYARGGERLRAIDLYRSVYNDGAAEPQIRNYARLRAAYLSLADGRDAVFGDLGDLASAGGLYGLHAQEVMALAALGEKDYETAQSLFRQLSIDPGAPAGLRSRAEDFAALASAGKAGVNITGEARVEDLVRAIGEAGPQEAPGPDGLGGEDAVDGVDAIDGAIEQAPDMRDGDDLEAAIGGVLEEAAENAGADSVDIAAPGDDAVEEAPEEQVPDGPAPDDGETN